MKEVPSGSCAVISLPQKIFLPVPLHQNLLSMPAYQVHENRELAIIEWCQVLNPNGSRMSLWKENPFHNDKQIKSNLIFQRFWALSIVLATSTCLANGTLASTVPQGDLTIVGITSFPPNIYNCTSNMDIMTTTSSLSTAKQIEHRLLLSEKVILINKNIKHPQTLYIL